ncbi:MAG TPA: hypothetical protein VEV17_23215 [Bryobacteraceae bacterium]|nr:hypothetical protein [Bryobacteraceae bacterium]
MHRGNAVLAVATLIAAVPQIRAQVLAPPEILDPAMRALQQKHLPELKAAAVDITTHNYPYKFYLSRTLDVTEKQEQVTDQRSVRFSNFQGHTVLQVTGNYFASYSEDSMNQNERVKETYLDVVLPILRATAPRLASETQLSAFAIEVAHHVRKKVLGVTVERPENLALIVPRATAEKVAASDNVNEQVTALLESRVFIDGNPVKLWPHADVTASESSESEGPVRPSPAITLAERAPAADRLVAPTPAPPPVIRDLSPETLRKQQASYQGMIEHILLELDADAHFVSYAPPVLVAFHGMSYLQLSVTTNLVASDSGSQYRIAALAFDRHVSHLIRPLLSILEKDPDFDGIVFSSTVRIPPKTGDSAASEAVEFFLSLTELRLYAQYDITGQQLINSGFVLINGERVGLELQTAESDIR